MVVANVAGSTPSAAAVLAVNRPPVALDNGAATRQNHSVNVAFGKLLANDSDPDGDPFTVISVSPNTPNGGTAQLGLGVVIYSPATNFTGLDTYTYTISDWRGGTATATVEIRVLAGNLPSLNQVYLAPTTGGFRVLFAGISGYEYELQRSTDLVTWITIATLTAPLHGILEFEDLTNLPAAFYRTTAP